MNPDTKALRALAAEAAVVGNGTWWSPESSHFDKVDARFIAAASPATVLALLDRIEALEAALGKIAELADRCEACDPPDTLATHATTDSVTGLPMFLCGPCAKDVDASYRKAESKGCGRQPEIEEHEQDVAVAIAIAAMEAK